MNDQSNTATNIDSIAIPWRTPHRLIFYGVIAIILIAAPHLMPNNYWLRIFTMTGLWIMLALRCLRGSL